MTFSVSELNEYVSLMFSNDPVLTDVSVRGEISGFKRHTSGHLYFSLKDKDALIKCVMFRGDAWSLAFRPEDGQQVVATGRASLYKKDGTFQLYVNTMQQEGDGVLYARYLALKRELEREGLFDREKKKPPFLPRHVGVVTSGSGAAIQDIYNVITRRFPKMNITLCPVKVQGQGAAAEIARGIRRINAETDCDVLIVGRGGGSMEDLWCFNERVVAEAIAESRIPVISAVGHETDFTIADFVADLRAPTPSAAAELCVPEFAALKEQTEKLAERILLTPERTIGVRREKLGFLLRSRGFAGLELAVVNERKRLEDLLESVVREAAQHARDMRARLGKTEAMLGTLSPDAVLERGYAIVRDAEGRTVSAAERLGKGDRITVRFGTGAVGAVVEERIPEGK